MFHTAQYVSVLKMPIKDRQCHLKDVLSEFENEISDMDEAISLTEERIKNMEAMPLTEPNLMKLVIEGFRTCSDLTARLDLMDGSLQRIEQAFRAGHISEHDEFRHLSFEVSFRLDSIRDLRQRCQQLYSTVQRSMPAARSTSEEPPSSWLNIMDIFSCAVSRKEKRNPRPIVPQ